MLDAIDFVVMHFTVSVAFMIFYYYVPLSVALRLRITLLYGFIALFA